MDNKEGQKALADDAEGLQKEGGGCGEDFNKPIAELPDGHFLLRRLPLARGLSRRRCRG